MILYFFFKSSVYIFYLVVDIPDRLFYLANIKLFCGFIWNWEENYDFYLPVSWNYQAISSNLFSYKIPQSRLQYSITVCQDFLIEDALGFGKQKITEFFSFFEISK